MVAFKEILKVSDFDMLRKGFSLIDNLVDIFFQLQNFKVHSVLNIHNTAVIGLVSPFNL
jgi:hypothetical protein